MTYSLDGYSRAPDDGDPLTQLRRLSAELGSVKDWLETIERIVTDSPSKLSHEIDALAIDKGGRA